MEALLRQLDEHEDNDLIMPYLERIIDANPEVFEEMMNVVDLYEIYNRIGDKRGYKEALIQEGEAKGVAKGKMEKARNAALKMLQKGYQTLEIADILDMPVNLVESLAK